MVKLDNVAFGEPGSLVRPNDAKLPPIEEMGCPSRSCSPRIGATLHAIWDLQINLRFGALELADCRNLWREEREIPHEGLVTEDQITICAPKGLGSCRFPLFNKICLLYVR